MCIGFDPCLNSKWFVQQKKLARRAKGEGSFSRPRATTGEDPAFPGTDVR